ncbi:hypothetical protein SAMN05216483_0600 [Streptomyces sp. 2131.1]|nr:hypothetical protein SAMN05216483_0600 [Streptomyces sp. 2131.1]
MNPTAPSGRCARDARWWTVKRPVPTFRRRSTRSALRAAQAWCSSVSATSDAASPAGFPVSSETVRATSSKPVARAFFQRSRWSRHREAGSAAQVFWASRARATAGSIEVFHLGQYR